VLLVELAEVDGEFFISAGAEGGAGGGIDKSTGDGESPGGSPLTLFFRFRADRIKGVDDADLVVLEDFLELPAEGVLRTAGDGRERDNRDWESAFGDAARLLDVFCRGVSVLYASIQGLVRGDRSKSISPGDGSGTGGLVLKTRLAGAE
jgi:hypothetical protein